MMNVALFKPKIAESKKSERTWSNQELADFYRAVDILKQAGLNTDVDFGITDEGDPWLVFIRPENGDVIAHFAHIDGSFIAVSSVDQKVYKGVNIRGIVDQMLDSYPVLLPQSRENGRLLLHPTAAISAFLAAAFILTIDGVKVSNIGEVIFTVALEKVEISANVAAALESGSRIESLNLIRSEPLKLMFSELNATNYNVAILGAALIAHELSQSEIEVDRFKELTENVIASKIVDKKTIEGDEATIIIDSGSTRALSNEVGGENSLGDVQVNNVNNDGNEPRFNEGFRFAENVSVDVGQLIIDDSPEESGPTLAQLVINYENSRKSDKLAPQAVLKVSLKGAQSREGNELLEVSELVGGAEEDASFQTVGADLGFKSLEGDFEGITQFVSSSFASTQMLLSDSFGVAMDATGGFRVVSLQDLGASLDRGKGDKILEPSFEVIPTKTSHAYLESTDLNDTFSVEPDVKQGSVFEPNAPILGHSLHGQGETLSLSNAIDVVFYQGGDSVISQFELGTDLLWFFLSGEELASANNSVNESGDLILDFGDIGTLTFLGMVADPMVEALV